MLEKNKGFTLIELLATLVILSLLSLMIVPSINKVIQTNKKSSYNVQINSIKDSLKAYAGDNVFKIPSNKTIYLTLYQLSKEGYCDLNIKNPLVGGNFPIDMILEIKNDASGFEYIVDDTTGNDQYSDSQLDNIGSLMLKNDFETINRASITDYKAYIKEAKYNGADHTSNVLVTTKENYVEYKLVDNNGIIMKSLLNTFDSE